MLGWYPTVGRHCYNDLYLLYYTYLTICNLHSPPVMGHQLINQPAWNVKRKDKGNKKKERKREKRKAVKKPS